MFCIALPYFVRFAMTVCKKGGYLVASFFLYYTGIIRAVYLSLAVRLYSQTTIRLRSQTASPFCLFERFLIGDYQWQVFLRLTASNFGYRRQIKAESLIITCAAQSASFRIYQSETVSLSKPCKGVILITPLQGFLLMCIPFRRAIPYAIDFKAFSLNLTTMPHNPLPLTLMAESFRILIKILFQTSRNDRKNIASLSRFLAALEMTRNQC